jgi:hypothetical protein
MAQRDHGLAGPWTVASDNVESFVYPGNFVYVVDTAETTQVQRHLTNDINVHSDSPAHHDIVQYPPEFARSMYLKASA